ncbi:MAG: hypothetical protein ACBR15_01750 [Microcoleus sp.]
MSRILPLCNGIRLSVILIELTSCGVIKFRQSSQKVDRQTQMQFGKTPVSQACYRERAIAVQLEHKR